MKATSIESITVTLHFDCETGQGFRYAAFDETGERIRPDAPVRELYLGPDAFTGNPPRHLRVTIG
jgi:hypothetical protein